MTAAYGKGWKAFRRMVFATYGRTCHLKLEGCTGYATTVDHLDPVVLHGASLPSLARARPACRHCNSSTGATLGNALRANRKGRPTPSRKW